MTKEEIKKIMPLMQAMLEGKTIQRYYVLGGEWVDTEHISLEFEDNIRNYRIKPEPKYRPFKTQEECWNEMQKHQPYGWLKSKKDGRFHCIGEVSWSDKFETVNISLSTSESLSRSSNSVFEEYAFADGAPFGVIEE